MTDTLIEWARTPEIEAAPGVMKRRLEGRGASLVMIRIAAGIGAPRHTHAHEQFVQVLSGTGWLETEEGRKPLGPGCVFHFPPETWHAASFETDTVLVEVNLASPGA